MSVSDQNIQQQKNEGKSLANNTINHLWTTPIPLPSSFTELIQNTIIMNINFSVKQLGKRRPFINKIVIDLPLKSEQVALRQFLTALVTQQVNAFNARKEDKTLISFLSEKQVESKLNTTGKAGFGDSYNNQKADIEQAVENVHQAFDDGLIAFFLDDNQIENLDQEISLTESSHITIIRLTFLAGSHW